MKTKTIILAVSGAFTFAVGGVVLQQDLQNPSETAEVAKVVETVVADPVIPTITPLQVDAVTPPPPPLYAQITYTKKGKLQAGDSMLKALTRAGIPEQARRQIIKNLSSCLDFRRLRPGDTFSVDLDHEENLLRCNYESGPLNKYTVVKQDDVYVAAQSEIPLTMKTVSLSGKVNSSLFNTMAGLNLSPKLIYTFADIFASRLDFNVETRPTDSFSIVYEEYYQGNDRIGYGNILYAGYKQKNGDNHEGFFRKDKDGNGSHFTREGEELGSFLIRSPLPMGRLTSKFTWHRKHPILGVVRPHLGVDLAAPTGTPIMAAGNGKVIFRGRRGGFGKQVIIKHANGYKTYYGHLSGFSKHSRLGSRVKQKQIIGYVGSTGLSTGPHLDYRISHNGKFTNPFALKFKPRSILTGIAKTDFDQSAAKIMATVKSSEDKIISVQQLLVKPDDSISLL
ncbi:MAG: peptidoglycan DD-metalloendopeptidase family protein [Thermodesulfobacteriota bacterium]